MGFHAGRVDRDIPRRNLSVDLFGFADVFAFKGARALLVQCTSFNNRRDRLAKVLHSPIAHDWVKTPNHYLEVWGWRTNGQFEVTRIRESDFLVMAKS